MKPLFFLIILLQSSLTSYVFSQKSDTINGYSKKIAGEEINYFSPVGIFAKTALLTRCNGNSPVEIESKIHAGKNELVTYDFLIGHSSGTSSDERKFDISLNGIKLFSLTTPMKKTGEYSLFEQINSSTSYKFVLHKYDINKDAFGKLSITVPSSIVKEKANFTFEGQNQNSRDWLMVFMYEKGLKIKSFPTNLITQKEDLRQLNVLIDNPFHDGSTMSIRTKNFNITKTIPNGYSKLSILAYFKDFHGIDTIQYILNSKDTVQTIVNIKPIKEFVFNIVHHSHNDIGYSHLQADVEEIQNQNIRDALFWTSNNIESKSKPIWHIESLWAVENFLRIASSIEKDQFIKALKNGSIILSVNYANILTGLCQEEELNWVLEYAKTLEKEYGISIKNGMMTDVPGISRAGLLSYTKNNIPYLSLGPNYVESMPDKGDRVGSVIRDQGDKIFYWTPDSSTNKRVLVWTAGKGYSFFHGIQEDNKQQEWENRISLYCEELQEKNYPFEMVQLRYTKNSDNGPVDLELCTFIDNWNSTYKTPQLKIASINTLFEEFEKKYKNEIPTLSGEISPYWEDGAYSTAIEEMENRELVLKTIALEKYAKEKKKYEINSKEFYLLHRNLILFHEHTWGAWCSISDPEISFTTDQWNYKKSFLDSAKIYYSKLSEKLSFEYSSTKTNSKSKKPIHNFEVDVLNGGLKTITVEQQNIVSQTAGYYFFEPIYALGINPTELNKPINTSLKTIADNRKKKIVQVNLQLPSMKDVEITYALNKKTGKLTCHYSFYKTSENKKESMHIAFPFAFENSNIKYGNKEDLINLSSKQLPGSNKDFVCVEEKIILESNKLSAIISSPKINIFEIGSLIDETKTNGAKTWENETVNNSLVFLYVYNNYWHTNYKAYQEGSFDFEIELSFE